MQLGWFNVDAMLETGGPQHLFEWREFAELEPWGDDWERSSLITARTINTLHGIAAKVGGEEINELDLIDDDAFVPKRRDDTRTKRQADTDKGVEKLEQASQEVYDLLR